MNPRLHTIGLWSVVVLLAGALLVTATWSPLRLTSTPVGNGSYLFVVSAESGTLSPSINESEYTLTLDDVGDAVTYFADRPNRDAGTDSVDAFIRQAFATGGVLPNAALVAALDDGTSVTLALELAAPSYQSAGTDPSRLILTAHLLEGTTPGLSDFEVDTSAGIPATFGSAKLFVDNAHDQCRLTINNATQYPLEITSVDPNDASSWGHGDVPSSLSVATNGEWFLNVHGSDWNRVTMNYTLNGRSSHMEFQCHRESGDVAFREIGCHNPWDGTFIECVSGHRGALDLLGNGGRASIKWFQSEYFLPENGYPHPPGPDGQIPDPGTSPPDDGDSSGGPPS